MKFLLVPLSLGVLASTVGCSGVADIPNTPDLSALIANYNAPSANLDTTEEAMSVLDDIPQLKEIVAGFRSTNYVLTGIDKVSETDGKRTGARIQLQGAIHATLRCPGALGDPVYDAATNGTVSLTIALAQNSIRRTIGGEAVKCALQGTLLGVTVPVVINGPIALDLGRDLSLGNRWSGVLLVSLAELRVADRFSFFNLSARFDNDHVEHLFQLPNGNTVVVDVAPDSIRIHGRNGTWVCSESQSCLPG